jgi:hypothetical protein
MNCTTFRMPSLGNFVNPRLCWPRMEFSLLSVYIESQWSHTLLCLESGTEAAVGFRKATVFRKRTGRPTATAVCQRRSRFAYGARLPTACNSCKFVNEAVLAICPRVVLQNLLLSTGKGGGQIALPWILISRAPLPEPSNCDEMLPRSTKPAFFRSVGRFML